MRNRPSVICLEFNELTPSLMNQFIDAGHLPNFQLLQSESTVFRTDARATGEWLNPWVQWVTIHSGLEASEHEVYRLSNAYKLKTPAIWDVISEAGGNVWVCGSMNPWCSEALNGHILPDPWSHQVNPYPQGEFEVYDNFVRKNVQEHASGTDPVTWFNSIQFVADLMKRGLRAATAYQIATQLMKERLGRHRWKRAAVLDTIQCDLFEWYYKKYQPSFATFFSNSTAHYQHKFWRNMQPEAFSIRPTASEQRTYKNAILYSYQQMDRIVGRILKLAPQATIMLISGLSQQPFQEKDHEGGLRHYRLHGKNALTEVLKICGEFSYEPIMADEFFLRFLNEIDAEQCAMRLNSIRLPDGTPAFSAELDGNDVIAQCRCRVLMPENAQLTIGGEKQQVDFNKVFYWVDSLKSGTHHPAGIFWIRQPAGTCDVRDETVSLTTVAPTILDILNIEKPNFMQDESVFENSTQAEPSIPQHELVLT